jgi:hypothetical protein
VKPPFPPKGIGPDRLPPTPQSPRRSGPPTPVALESGFRWLHRSSQPALSRLNANQAKAQRRRTVAPLPSRPPRNSACSIEMRGMAAARSTTHGTIRGLRPSPRSELAVAAELGVSREVLVARIAWAGGGPLNFFGRVIWGKARVVVAGESVLRLRNQIRALELRMQRPPPTAGI